MSTPDGRWEAAAIEPLDQFLPDVEPLAENGVGLDNLLGETQVVARLFFIIGE